MSKDDLRNKIKSKGTVSDNFLDTFEEDINPDETDDSYNTNESQDNSSNNDESDVANDTDDNLEEHRPKQDDQFWEELTTEDPSHTKPKRNKVLTTFYIEPDLHDVVNQIAKSRGKGYKTKLINESIRFALESKGLI